MYLNALSTSGILQTTLSCTTSFGFPTCNALANGVGIHSSVCDIMQCIHDCVSSRTSSLTSVYSCVCVNIYRAASYGRLPCSPQWASTVIRIFKLLALSRIQICKALYSFIVSLRFSVPLWSHAPAVLGWFWSALQFSFACWWQNVGVQSCSSLCWSVFVSHFASCKDVGKRIIGTINMIDGSSKNERYMDHLCTFDSTCLAEFGPSANGANTYKRFLWSVNTCTGCSPQNRQTILSNVCPIEYASFLIFRPVSLRPGGFFAWNSIV